MSAAFFERQLRFWGVSTWHSEQSTYLPCQSVLRVSNDRTAVLTQLFNPPLRTELKVMFILLVQLLTNLAMWASASQMLETLIITVVGCVGTHL